MNEIAMRAGRSQPTTATRTSVLIWLYFVFFLSGCSSLMYQTAWQRMLGLFGGSDAIGATIVVGAFLFGLGVGSLIAVTFADRLSSRRATQAFAACEFGIAAYAAASPFLFYDIIFQKLITAADQHAVVLLIVFTALLPPTTLMGMSLPCSRELPSTGSSMHQRESAGYTV